jgi:hypothetical protein
MESKKMHAWIRSTHKGFACVLATTLALLPFAASAQFDPPTPVQGMYLQIASRCVTPTAAGGVVLGPCYTNDQKWKFYGVRKNWRGFWDVFMIRNDALGMCLAIKGTDWRDNAPLEPRACSATTVPVSDMLWFREDAIEPDGWNLASQTKWRNMYSTKCMDAGDRHLGIALTQWTCAGSSWSPQDFTGYYY